MPSIIPTTINTNDLNQNKIFVTNVTRNKHTKQEIIDKYNNTPCKYDTSHICAIKSCSLGKCERVNERFYARSSDDEINKANDTYRYNSMLNRLMAKRMSRKAYQELQERNKKELKDYDVG